ncbi:MAG TPA: division/cell wall cluster transcriptional repressor MraZ [Acidimicrobiales bacterium]|nr:division/cell wall cluster transcriptional repressor MraZ [Acidimicrobiales bacterium]
MVRFIGRFEHSLDPKGRVILPAKFRSAFERGAVVAQHHEGCLAVWDPATFEARAQEMERLEEEGPESRNLARVWASGSHEAEVDRQGRLAIPAHLREYAGLEGEVLVTGAINRVELWNPQRWEQQVRPAERRLTGEEDQAGATTT